MEPMDVEEGSDVIGADGKDDRTSASPPSPPEVSSAAMASEAMEGLEASAGQDDHGDPHRERVASVEAKPGPSTTANPGEDAADEEEEGAAAAAAPVRTSPSNQEGERARLSDYVGSRSAYRRDQCHKLTLSRPLAQADGRTCARWSSCFHLRRCALRSPDP
jgi:hypothetical protein